MTKITKIERFQGEDLVLELIGVVDTEKAAVEYPDELLMEFFTRDHPARNKDMMPCKIEKTGKMGDLGKVPLFGIFVAIKDINKLSSRNLPERSAINELKKKYPFIFLDENWKSFEEVIF